MLGGWQKCGLDLAQASPKIAVADYETEAERMRISDNAVHKHIGNIFAKLGLAPDDSGHRRVRAVLAYLDGMPGV